MLCNAFPIRFVNPAFNPAVVPSFFVCLLALQGTGAQSLTSTLLSLVVFKYSQVLYINNPPISIAPTIEYINHRHAVHTNAIATACYGEFTNFEERKYNSSTCSITSFRIPVRRVLFFSYEESKGWPSPLDLRYWGCFSVSSSK